VDAATAILYTCVAKHLALFDEAAARYNAVWEKNRWVS